MSRLKKAISFLTWILFVSATLYPTAVGITACLGYRFVLTSVSAFAVAFAALTVCIVLLDLVGKNTVENKTLQILLAMIAPLSLVHAAFCLFECPQVLVIASAWISAGCCCCLTVKYGKPLSLKIAALVLSALLMVPMGFFSYISLFFGKIGQNTVVQTVESPSGKYYAQVIDSDQGALGGDTLVEVYQKPEIRTLLFKIEKKPQRVYSGDWGEFESMQMHWKSDQCLVINCVAYEIE